MRIYDINKVKEAFTILDPKGKINVEEWVNDPVNIVLENEHSDIALFEYGLPQKRIYSGHYYFKTRGRKAIESAKGFLDELFNSCYNIDILMGLVPIKHKAARWITRQVGFTSYGIQEIHDKEYELFILTKKEFNCG